MARPSFPKTLREFQAKFASEEACQRYLVSCRWPDGFVCLRCGNRRAYELGRHRRWQCAACGRQVSLTAKTILHNTKTPLTAWFWAAYLMTTDKARCFGATVTAPAWPATIRNSVDDAPQIPASNGQPGNAIRYGAKWKLTRPGLEALKPACGELLGYDSDIGWRFNLSGGKLCRFRREDAAIFHLGRVV
jgi:hypothetical protein